MVDDNVRGDSQGDASRSTRSARHDRLRYEDILDAFDDDLGPTPQEIEAWAARERRRRQEWASGPTDRDRLMWARRERMRRLDRETFADGCSDRVDEPRARMPRSARSFQNAAHGAAVEFLTFPFRILDMLVDSGRAYDRPAGRRRDQYDDDLDY